VKRDRSTAAFERAKHVIPAGLNSPVRAFRSVGGTPVFVKSASGCMLIDVDDNAYIDYVMCGALISVTRTRLSLPPCATQPSAARRSARRRSRVRTRGARHRDGAVDRARALLLERHRSDDERVAARTRLHRSRQGDQVCRLLSRPRRRVPDLGRSGALTTASPIRPASPKASRAITIVVDYNDIDGLRAALRNTAKRSPP